MLGTVCGQSVPEREMSRDVGEGSSVRPRGPGTSKVPYSRTASTVLPCNQP